MLRSDKIISLRKHQLLQLACALLLLVSLQSCGNKTLIRHSKELSNKAAGSSERVRAFYSKLESSHAQMRIEELKLQPLAETPIDSAAPGPNCPFTEEHSAKLITSARFIETLAASLNGLIGSNSEGELKKAIADVNGQLKGFDIRTFSPLAALQSASTPITTTLKIVGRRGFAMWAGRWYKQALCDTNDVFVEQCKLLQFELNADADEAERRATSLQGLAERVYRKKVSTGESDSQLKLWLDEVQRYSKLRQSVTADNPSETYSELLDIHHNLMNEVPENLKSSTSK